MPFAAAYLSPMRLTWIGLFTVLLVPLTAAAQTVAERLTVVELFTSQGCSSCPPADALLGELAKRPDVLALSEHVDYWDYLGWHDPFASHENTRRQRAYSRHLGLSYVYTPQIIVQGAMHTTGADRDQVQRLITRAHSLPRISIGIHRDETGGLIAKFNTVSLPEVVDVWLVRFDRSRATAVADGENGGRQIINYNVVRTFTRLTSWDGSAITVPIPEPEQTTEDTDEAILVQQPLAGRILGAARMQTPVH